MGIFKHKASVVEAPLPAPDLPVVQIAPVHNAKEILEDRLRHAVAGLRFHLAYQPVVSVADGGIVGLEALLRWESEAGRVTPATFIPLLEATGLVKDLGPWIIGEACRESLPWVQTHPDLFVTVNVSPQQLQAGFSDTVLEVIRQARFDAGRLCLELIQPAFIADPDVAWNELRRLKQAGVRLLVDDFGALGSSIADLRRFAVDAVKIDDSFVAELGRNSDDDAVVAAIITLAHALGMETVAEGVETAAQLELLRDLGCDLAQGFHFAKPVAAPELQALLDRQRRRP